MRKDNAMSKVVLFRSNKISWDRFKLEETCQKGSSDAGRTVGGARFFNMCGATCQHIGKSWLSLTQWAIDLELKRIDKSKWKQAPRTIVFDMRICHVTLDSKINIGTKDSSNIGRKKLKFRIMKPPPPFAKWRIASTIVTVPPTSAIERCSCQVSLVISNKSGERTKPRICTYLHLNLSFRVRPVSRVWRLIIFFSLDTTQLNNLVQSLTSYRNEPAYVSPTPSTMVISSDQDFGQVYGQGDQGKF